MVSMIMAILLSFINWKLDHSTVSIKPDLISCIMAFEIYSAYVLRIKGLQRMTSYIDLVFMVLLILLFSSFIQCILLSILINSFVLIFFSVYWIYQRALRLFMIIINFLRIWRSEV